MKISRFTQFLCLLLVVFSSQLFSLEIGQKLEKLTTSEDKTYHKVTIRKILPHGLVIFHKIGAATIPAEELPQYDEIFQKRQAEELKDNDNKEVKADKKIALKENLLIKKSLIDGNPDQ